MARGRGPRSEDASSRGQLVPWLPFRPSEVVSENGVLWPAPPTHSFLMVRRQEGPRGCHLPHVKRGGSKWESSAGLLAVFPKDTDIVPRRSQILLPRNHLHSAGRWFSGQIAVHCKCFTFQNVVRYPPKCSTNNVLPKGE